MHKLCWGIVFLAASNTASAAELTIYAVNGPVAYLSQRLAGDAATVVMPVSDDTDPAFWEPGADAIAEFQAADLIVLNGADYAKWTATASLPRAKTVNASKGLEGRFIEVEKAATHSHGDGEAHSHAGTAFTTWLDFDLTANQAGNIADALKRQMPDEASAIDTRLTELSADLAHLQDQAQALGTALAGQPLIASHPIYQYFAQAYDINLKSVPWEPNEVPTQEQLDDMAALLVDHPASFMIWEDAPIQDASDAVAKLGLESLVFKTGNGDAPDSDMIALWRHGIETLQAAIP